MKVCHLTSAHPNLDKRIFRKECISLNRAGYETYIIAQGESFKEQGVYIIGIPRLRYGRLERVLLTTRRVYNKSLEIDADIYHIHDPELLPYALKLKRRGKTVIFDSHEDFFVVAEESKYIPKFLRKLVSKIVSKYITYACKRLDVIISVTPHICEKYKKINKNTYMITNYPVISNNEKLTPINKLSLNKAIAFAGGINSGDNHEKIINAISKIDDTKYILCGKGEKSYIDELKKLKGWKFVDYKGQIKYESVHLLLQKARMGIILVKPNITTGYNIGTLGNTKIFEYMRAGLPVICTNFKLWEDLINEHKCGICVDPNNEIEIFNAIKYLLDNYEIACDMGKNAQHAIIKEYNWSTQEIKLLEIYKMLTKNIMEKSN